MILKCFVDIHNAQRLKMMEGKYIIESNDRIHRLPWETNEMSYLITYEKQPLLNHEHRLKHGLFLWAVDLVLNPSSWPSHTILLTCSFRLLYSLQIFPKTVLKRGVLYSKT